jgi:hypothetical protein
MRCGECCRRPTRCLIMAAAYKGMWSREQGEVAQEPRITQERALELLRATLAIPRGSPTTEARRLVWAIRCAIVLGVLVLIASAVDKPLWAWLNLLIVPTVLAGGALWFNQRQQARAEASNDQRAQDEALQAYLGQMGELLLDKERPLRHSQEDEEIRTRAARARSWTLTALEKTLARSWTLTVLETFDGGRQGRRKRRVLRFLYESDLIRKCDPIIELDRADLRRAYLREANLRKANLSGTRLEGADLRKANLEGTDLSEANLSEANLSEANLSGAEGVTNEKLKAQAKCLEGATMPNSQKYEVWLEDKESRGEAG